MISYIIILIILIVLFTSLYVIKVSFIKPCLKSLKKSDVRVEVVVSRYNEDVTWLEDPTFASHHITCYNKGPKLSNKIALNILDLPNVGRCDHTYLYHIVKNYDRLADVTVFLPASCLDGSKACNTLQLMQAVMRTKTTVLQNTFGYNRDVREDLYDFTLDDWKASNPSNSALNPEQKLLPSPVRPFGKWFDLNFPRCPPIHVICYFGIFAVARQHITQHPRSRYEALLSYLDHHSNPEAGHYTERSWGAVFYPYPSSCIHEVDQQLCYNNYGVS